MSQHGRFSRRNAQRIASSNGVPTFELPSLRCAPCPPGVSRVLLPSSHLSIPDWPGLVWGAAKGNMVTMDMRPDRVRVYYNAENKVTRPPRVG